MAFFTISDTLHQKHLFSISLCKYPLPLTFSPPKHSLSLRKSPFFVVSQTHAKLSTTGHEPSSTETIKLRANGENASGVPLFRSLDERVSRKSVERSNVSLVEEEERTKRFTNDRYTKKRVGSGSRREMGSESSSSSSSVRSKYGSLGVKSVETKANSLVDGKINKNLRKGYENIKVGEEKMQKGSIKNKAGPRVAQLTLALEMCSKRGDVMGAIELYDSARREGITMGQYHCAVVLYLCSSAAGGVVRPAKSGSGNRSLSLNALDSSNEVSNVGSVDFGGSGVMDRRNFNGTNVGKEDSDRSPDGNGNIIQFSELRRANPKFINGAIHMRKGDNSSGNLKDGNDDKENEEILVSGDVKKYALQRGFDIYEKMCLEKVPMNEAILTSVARLAMSMGDGDMAFDMVKQIKTLGINLRLRSYGPALSAFCSSGDIEKAFAVEKHMLEHGVYPEEPELEALLRVSIEAGKSDKVYYLLHKLRSSVRKVLPSTAELIEKWFKSKEASRVGKGKWDKRLIKEAIECRGGGWHGQGWLGRGRWTVSHTTVGDDGLCKCCGVKLEIIDLDPTETENFAKSVASIAMQREKHSNFQRFQQWLDYYGPFEAVVDAANVGLFSQKRFMPSKINAVVNGIRQMLPSKKWPLIVLHNRRITGHKMDEPVNKALIEKWKIADALYATPTGSNDDWYWLYAAIKFKCLLVTNDEMRDHTFQLLGNDFFPKWKERHQVHFSFSDTGPEFHMPPPCSVVIQESEIGHWHIPVVSEHNSEGERTWLCITRAHSHMERQASTTRSKGSDTQNDVHTKPKPSSNLRHGKREVPRNPPQEMYKNLRNILSESVFSSHHPTILSEIEAAELLGNCIIDFEI